MTSPSDKKQLSSAETTGVDALYQELSENADVMRVLYALRQVGWAPNLEEITTAEAREKALEQGLVDRPVFLPTVLFLNEKGHQALTNWRNALDQVIRQDRFQVLLRHVIAW
ncbi:hypothetical protein [Saccharopolyspora hattusasensis]|uniref:hypothetical protein n=1 Tax=Saccharopolyspora hattusasensis TaxID=1128679 RepID=UPI003D98AC3C